MSVLKMPRLLLEIELGSMGLNMVSVGFMFTNMMGCYLQVGLLLKLGMSITTAFKTALMDTWVRTMINKNTKIAEMAHANGGHANGGLVLADNSIMFPVLSQPLELANGDGIDTLLSYMYLKPFCMPNLAISLVGWANNGLGRSELGANFSTNQGKTEYTCVRVMESAQLALEVLSVKGMGHYHFGFWGCATCFTKAAV